MLVIICTKYGKNPSRTVDATERTRFSKSRLNDLEDIGQGQRSLHATHPLMLMMICAKYGKNASRIVDFFQGESQKIRKVCEKLKFYNFVINLTCDTPSNASSLHTLFVANMEITDQELKTLQSGHNFQSQGRMTLKI